MVALSHCFLLFASEAALCLFLPSFTVCYQHFQDDTRSITYQSDHYKIRKRTSWLNALKVPKYLQLDGIRLVREFLLNFNKAALRNLIFSHHSHCVQQDHLVLYNRRSQQQTLFFFFLFTLTIFNPATPLLVISRLFLSAFVWCLLLLILAFVRLICSPFL